jgi:hypothetical protein
MLQCGILAIVRPSVKKRMRFFVFFILCSQLPRTGAEKDRARGERCGRACRSASRAPQLSAALHLCLHGFPEISPLWAIRDAAGEMALQFFDAQSLILRA